jgi:hypothetical protein
MATITTHPGGPFYVWYVSVYGVAPPATVDSNAARYLAWTEGMPKALAATIPYGSIGPPGDFVAGAALVAPIVITTPASSTPVTAPAATLVEAGVTQVAAPAPPAPAPVATTASSKALPTQYGQTLTSEQIQICDDVFNVGIAKGVSRLVLEAAYYAMMGESTISLEIGNGGVFQTTCDMSAYDNGADYKSQAASFYSGGTCFARGAVSYSSEYNTAWQVANATEENKVWSQSRGDSYARGGYTTATLTAEAAYAVSYFLPGLGGTSVVQGTPAPTEAPPSTSTIQGLQSLVHELDWSGDFENLWDALAAGCKTVDDTAQTLYTHISGITTIGWT